MARTLGTYIKDILRECYATYASIIRQTIIKRDKPVAQRAINATLVQGFIVAISETILYGFIGGPDQTLLMYTTKCYCGMSIIQSGEF